MERLTKHKVWGVWLLIAILALPFAAKTVHVYHINDVHEEHNNCSEHSHPNHNCDNCPVCQFTLSTFIEATFIDHDFSIIPVDFKPVISYRSKVYQSVFIPCGLRAPPMI